MASELNDKGIGVHDEGPGAAHGARGIGQHWPSAEVAPGRVFAVFVSDRHKKAGKRAARAMADLLAAMAAMPAT